MPLDPPICLEVLFTNVQPTLDPNIYTATFTTNGQGYDSGNNYYSGMNVGIGMWAANNAYGYSFRIKSIANESPESIDVILEDVDGFNASIDPSGIGGGPGNNTIGYVYELNECGLPVLTEATNPPNFTWTESQLARFLYQQQCRGLTGSGSHSNGETGATGAQGASGYSTHTGATGAQGDTGPQGVPGFASQTGATGSPGQGVPTGGAQGQILMKIDGTDYNTTWANGGNSTYNDNWIATNFLNPPPPIVFQTVSATTTEIFIPWIYPTQSPAGFSWIPAITNLSMQISIDSNIVNPGVSPYQVSTLVNVSSGYINNHDGTPYVTGMVLSKIPGTNEIESRIFPDTSHRQAYVYHDTNLANMISSPNSYVIGWYRNTNPSINVASTVLTTFSLPGSPSAVDSLALTLSVSTGVFSYTAPQSIDTTDISTKLTIRLYIITYFSIASSIRYGSPLSDSTHTLSNGTNLVYTPIGLYPDSQYTFSVTATNSGGQVGPSRSITQTTGYLLPISSLSGTLPFPPRYYSNGTIVSITSGIPKSHLINSISPWILTSPIPIPIHNISTRGSSQTSTLMTLSASVTNGSNVISGPSLYFSGFPSAGNPQTTTSHSITITPTLKDTYSSPGGSFTGFYLESDTLLSLNTPIFVPSPYDYTLTLNQSGTFTGSASFSYQYDTLITTVPVIQSITLSFNGDISKPISGINVLYNAPSFTVTATLQNMGHYYYSSPLLTYSGGFTQWSPSSEVTPINVISGLSNGAFLDTIVIQNKSVQSASLLQSYATLFTITVVANNIYGSSAPFTSPGVPVIVDGPSVTLVYTTLPQTIPRLALSSTNVIGYHVSSGIAGASGVPPFTNGSTPYANSPYNQTLDITTTQELQISNGTFTTPTGQPYAYINYNTLYYTSTITNTNNYTTIPGTGYRYATFSWTIAPDPTHVYGTLQFTVVGTSGIYIINNLAYIGSDGTNQIQMFYRIENTASPTPTNLANQSSAWINGNSTSGISSTSGNYYIPSDYTLPPYYGLNSVSGLTSPVFSVKIPSLVVQTGQQINLYCRIGIPMNVAFSFQYITATIS